MREKGMWSSTSFDAAAAEASAKGSATYAGEQRARQGKGLDPLVDPKAYGGVRLAMNFLVPDGDAFVLESGIAMPVKTDLDTTGSMGGNVDLAFRSLPKLLGLLAHGPNAVLKRYHTQIATGVVQDENDRFPYQVSQFEPDNEIDRQMGMLVPERSGGDAPEDYQFGVYATARLTRSSVTEYGLKGYYFVVGDEEGRDRFNLTLLKKIFGAEQVQAPPPKSTHELAEPLLENWHAFFLQVGDNPRSTKWWAKLLGPERVVHLPRTEDIAEVQACVIGLTEGVIDLQSAADFLVEGAEIPKEEAKKIVRACAKIPIGAQAEAPNFGRIPLAGARFASRDDIWPVGDGAAAKKAEAKPKGGKSGGGIKWE